VFRGMLQLDAHYMDDVAQKQDFCPLDEFIASMSRSMTSSGTTCIPSTIGSEPLNVCHLPALMYGAAMALRALEERLRILRCLSSDSGDSKSRFRPSPRKHRHLERRAFRPEWSGADVIGMEVRDQNEVDLFRRVACAAEAARQAPEGSPTPQVPAPASTRISCLPC